MTTPIYIAGGAENPLQRGASDIVSSLKNYKLWSFLGWQDIRQRYRRSILGPLWLTVSTGIMVVMISVLYGRMFNLPLEIYTPFFASGSVVWTLISTLMIEGCRSFIEADSLIKQARIPLASHVMRTVWRNIVIFFHNIIILVPVWVIFGWALGVAQILWSFFALILIGANGISVGLILAHLCARFRDVGPLVSNFVQVAFFVTPIMWLPSQLEGRSQAWWITTLNPFYHFVEILRAPLLGHTVSVVSWWAVSAVTLVTLTLSIVVLGRFNRRVAYWL